MSPRRPAGLAQGGLQRLRAGSRCVSAGRSSPSASSAVTLLVGFGQLPDPASRSPSRSPSFYFATAGRQGIAAQTAARGQRFDRPPGRRLGRAWPSVPRRHRRARRHARPRRRAAHRPGPATPREVLRLRHRRRLPGDHHLSAWPRAAAPAPRSASARAAGTAPRCPRRGRPMGRPASPDYWRRWRAAHPGVPRAGARARPGETSGRLPLTQEPSHPGRRRARRGRAPSAPRPGRRSSPRTSSARTAGPASPTSSTPTSSARSSWHGSSDRTRSREPPPGSGTERSWRHHVAPLLEVG